MSRRLRHRPLQVTRRRLAPPLERWLVFPLDRGAAALRESAGRALDLYGLKPTELAVLAIAADRGPTSQAAITEWLGVDRTSGSRIVSGLAATGLLERGPHPFDARKRAVALTEAGSHAFEAAAARLDEAEARFFVSFDDYELDDLRRMLRRLDRPL